MFTQNGDNLREREKEREKEREREREGEREGGRERGREREREGEREREREGEREGGRERGKVFLTRPTDGRLSRNELLQSQPQTLFGESQLPHSKFSTYFWHIILSR